MSLYDSTKRGRAAWLVMALSKLRQSCTSRNGSNPLSIVCSKSLQGSSYHTRTLLYISKPFTALTQGETESRSIGREVPVHTAVVCLVREEIASFDGRHTRRTSFT